MEIITRIPPAYFIPIEKTDLEPFKWLNAAQIESIDVLERGCVVYLINNQKFFLEGERAEKFIREINKMCAKYGGKNHRTA